jgi:hypothetical protein
MWLIGFALIAGCTKKSDDPPEAASSTPVVNTNPKEPEYDEDGYRSIASGRAVGTTRVLNNGTEILEIPLREREQAPDPEKLDVAREEEDLIDENLAIEPELQTSTSIASPISPCRVVDPKSPLASRRAQNIELLRLPSTAPNRLKDGARVKRSGWAGRRCQ